MKLMSCQKKNFFQLNCDKTKELIINFNRLNEQTLLPVYIEDKPIKSVKSTKLLRVTLNSELSWDNHIENILKNASRKLYFLVPLKRASVARLKFFSTILRAYDQIWIMLVLCSITPTNLNVSNCKRER